MSLPCIYPSIMETNKLFTEASIYSTKNAVMLIDRYMAKNGTYKITTKTT